MDANPYRAIVGEAWDALPPGVRLAHTPPLEAEGEMKIVRANRGLAGFVARRIELPSPGDAVPTRLTLAERDGVVEWTRTFGGMRAVSHQKFQRGHVRETAGPFEFEVAMETDGPTIRHRQIAVHILGVRLPRLLGPLVVGTVSAGPDDASWHVEITIGQPLLGTLSVYSGIMRVIQSSPR